MQNNYKFIIILIETALYIIMQSVINNKLYEALLSAPIILITTALIVFIRIKLSIQVKGNILNYYIITITIAYVICMIIL